ncbi:MULTISPECIES: serine/threonine-protein kinase [unclassified Microcoleus]|uniref:serine/threonine protein kinase n=1 Tax=unclassified Microcoleus TaxID=2642155 RepID=UPI002FD43E2F
MIQPEILLQNRYRIGQQLGKGGFGEIFELDDRGTRKVIKILNLDSLSDLYTREKALYLFQQEAEILKQLNHPGIPKVEADGYFTYYDGTHTRHYLVMEKIEGQNLHEWLKQTKRKIITQAEAINWLKQLIEILDYLHQHSYIHRDLKPTNIMRKPNGQLVLIDFGIVREITGTYLAKLAEDIELTQIGSPGYAPKEQMDGKPVPQSDFFALGRTLVYLLTGKLPCQLPTDDLTGKLIWQNQAPAVSESLAELINWLMAAFPTERPGDAQEILQYIEKNILTNEKSSLVQKSVAATSLNKYQKVILLRVVFGVAGFLVIGASTFQLFSPQIAVALTNRSKEDFIFNRLNIITQLYLNLAVTLDPNLAEPHYYLGLICLKHQDYDCALTKFQIAVQGSFERPSDALKKLSVLDQMYPNFLKSGEKLLGGIPLYTSCHKNYPNLKVTALPSNKEDAWSWRCVDTSGKELGGLDIDDICKEKYADRDGMKQKYPKNRIFSKPLNTKNAYSWRCIVRE